VAGHQQQRRGVDQLVGFQLGRHEVADQIVAGTPAAVGDEIAQGGDEVRRSPLGAASAFALPDPARTRPRSPLISRAASAARSGQAEQGRRSPRRAGRGRCPP
jgi:hypothetical protein